ncbi:hypothetical protein AMJ40_00770 [candidate division TA06 bacterium DG_26]|uniref:Uncharacterized protein n=1 Tax=candidate division TA06 bacterium DG_26 TaxID=1703771 RepID=A0A0S7WLW0_UNCT6|nr:MAG: hypothetical protein AMJ40_00770 [candidate division TA06 bacterium DG_26]
MRIDEYGFGRIVIDGKKYTTDVVIYPDRVDSSWWRKVGHELRVDDIEEAIRERPDVLIVGTGSPGLMKVLPDTRVRLRQEEIELIVMPTEQACHTFNEIVGAKKVVACLHLTC